jgi:dynein heavy chain
MAETSLLDLPSADTWTIDSFLSHSQAQCRVGVEVLISCSSKVEEAVKELIQLLRNTAVLPTAAPTDSEDMAKSKSEELEQFETECEDLFAHFQHRNLDALVCAVRSTLDQLRRRLTTSSSARNQYEDGNRPAPCFAAEVLLSLPNIVLAPSLEELQAVVSQVVQCVSDIGLSIPCWTPLTQTPTNLGAASNYQRSIHDSKDLLKLSSLLSSALLACRQDLMKALLVYSSYKGLYTLDREHVLADFQSNTPHLSEYEAEMERYERLEDKIAHLPSQQLLTAAIQLSNEPLKLALIVEARAWKTAYGQSLNARYRTSMNNIVHFVTEYNKRLSRPIKDLEDVRSTMAALDEVRAKEIEIDMELNPIEECYSFLQRCGVAVAREEMETVDSLRYTFKNLLAQAAQVQGHLVGIQPQFRPTCWKVWRCSTMIWLPS